MIYSLISSKTVVSKVLSDLNIREEDVRISSLYEWLGEAIEKIGAVTQLERKISGVSSVPVVTITGYQAALPTDLHRLNQIAYSTSETGPWLPMKMATGTFSMWPDTASISGGDSTFSVTDDVLISLIETLYELDYAAALLYLNENYNVRVILTNLIEQGNVNYNQLQGGLKYSIKPGYIVTNAPTGYIKLNYDAIPLDDNGYPMIPNMISYIEAAYWYVAMKLLYAKYYNGTQNNERYYDAKRSWNFYCKQAYAEAMMPNEDMMESVKNTWVRLVPEMSAHDEFFETIGDRQYINNPTR